MTDEQQNYWIAEKVMGWERNTEYWFDKCIMMYCSDELGNTQWNPRNNVAQALEALEAWCKQDNGRRYSIHGNPRHQVVELYCEFYQTQLAMTGGPNLAHAICDALVQATGGE